MVAAFTAGLVSLVQHGEALPAGDALVLMRICGTLLGGAAAFGLVDAMSADLGAAAVPRWVRQALRCLLPGGAAIAISYRWVLGTILLPQQVRLWPPTCGFGYWDQAHLFWPAMLPMPYPWLSFAERDLRS
ncbi:hypothetical protein ETD86_35855 [Nonomuraea turkmeniaca]|uniref:Uncharacterized protein n=1 Tax=Nonomuraea turkmeniaca TaxID=103838 RepID=A0A5S4F5C8_9ACTN|nr:hypothetical protein [Nonomuraea turkmeniaca]TMR11445.1 hypothetical protein ETD86_35855 [Nonomuraea turkmeniaca]